MQPKQFNIYIQIHLEEIKKRQKKFLKILFMNVWQTCVGGSSTLLIKRHMCNFGVRFEPGSKSNEPMRMDQSDHVLTLTHSHCVSNQFRIQSLIFCHINFSQKLIHLNKSMKLEYPNGSNIYMQHTLISALSGIVIVRYRRKMREQ